METTPVDESDEILGPPPIDFQSRKRRIILLCLAMGAVCGVVRTLVSDSDFEAYAPAIGFPLLGLGIAWCIADAGQRGHRIGRVATLLLVVGLPIGLPIYLFVTRGLGGFRSLAMLFGLIIAICLCAFTAGIATLFLGNMTGLWEIAF
jgi:hypothetical protein